MTMTQASPPTGNLRIGPHRVEVEPSPRWVRAELNGTVLADSKRVLLLRETDHLPVYYFPPADVRMDLLTPTETHTRCPYKGDASYWTATVRAHTVADVAWAYLNPLPGREDITGYLAFYWDKIDHWYEEAEEIFKHPRDPYHRVDVLPSTRHVKVIASGQVVAESDRPFLLFETGLPTRYYLPFEDVRMDLLEPTGTTSLCPYKGLSSYWRIRGDAGRDIAWAYLDPIAECPRIKGTLAFFDERVDAVEVDGEEQPKPHTAWSY